MKKILVAFALLVAASCGSSEKKPDAAATADSGPKLPAPKFDESVIARDALFGNPERTQPRVSPDGKLIAYLAPKDGVLNVWVAPVEDLAKATAVTDDKLRGIRMYMWAMDGKHLLYMQDQGGDENWHVYAVDAKASAPARDLTPFPKVSAQPVKVSPKKKDAVVVAMNDRDERFHDLYSVDLKTGARTLLETNDKGYLGYEVDDDYKVQLAWMANPDGSMDILKKGKAGFEPFVKVPAEDSMSAQILDFDAGGKKAYFLDPSGRDTAALVELEIGSGKKTVLHADDKADVETAVVHPKTKKVLAVAVHYDRLAWKFLDKGFEAAVTELKKAAPDGDLRVVSSTPDGNTWVFAQLLDAGPVKYWLFDGKKKKATFLLTDRPELEKLPLSKMQAVVIPSRDAMNLVSYLTVPAKRDPDGDGKPDAPLPMVLFVHGGPWGRDAWGFNPYHQWLADRGYAVLSVNFRGSTGFGKKFVNAADKQWAKAMHDDLLDAVDWAVKGGVADPTKVAIMGGSYGGYATLVGLTVTPDQFACGVDIVGPSNLQTLLENIPPYWAPFLPQLTTRVGDPKTDEGKALLKERSPLFLADKIKKPLLIGQGANDPRVKQQEADQIVDAMKKKGIAVTYVLYPDEGHGFARPPNRTSFNAVTEVFLSSCLGGVAEPYKDDLDGSTITVPTASSRSPAWPTR
jgi:dipeptidyl aminopeptidase/acylaminoacyl peptidase